MRKVTAHRNISSQATKSSADHYTTKRWGSEASTSEEPSAKETVYWALITIPVHQPKSLPSTRSSTFFPLLSGWSSFAKNTSTSLPRTLKSFTNRRMASLSLAFSCFSFLACFRALCKILFCSSFSCYTPGDQASHLHVVVPGNVFLRRLTAGPSNTV